MGCSFSSDKSAINSGSTKSDGGFKAMYKLGEEIGKGAFSVVKLAKNIKTKGKVAVKIIKQDKLTPHDAAALKEVSHFAFST